MWRLLRTSPLRRFSSAATSYVSDSEPFLRSMTERVALSPTLRGVVVRHLPEKDNLEAALGNWLGTDASKVRVMYTVEGKPAYGIVNLKNEAEVAKAVKQNKSLFESSKVFVTGVPEFLNINQPINGGFDSRRVVVSCIDPFWNESHLLDVLRPLGDVMGLYLPRDYDFPHNLESIGVPMDKALPEQFMTFRKVNLEWKDYIEEGKAREDVMDTARSNHFLTRAYDYFSNEFNYLSHTLQHSGLTIDSLNTVIGETHDLWCFIRALKDQIFHKPEAEEAMIDDLLNKLMQEPAQDKAFDVLLQIRTHSLNFLHSYFQNRGYAYVTFATRRQAERAIACSESIQCEGKQMQIGFHRNEPGFQFNSGKISEAIMEAIETYANKGRLYEEEKEASMLSRALFPSDAHFTHLRAHYHFVGESSDPVLEGHDPSFSSALKTKAKIDAIKAPTLELESDFKKTVDVREYMLSSDEEYFDDEEVGRVEEGASKKAEGEVLDRLYPSDKYAISALPSFEPFPRPDPSSVAKQVSEIQRFFAEAIPSVYKDKPHLLKTQRCGDHPQVRYVCSEPFDYSAPPKPKAFSDPAEKRKYVQKQIRNFILTLQLAQPTTPQSETIPFHDEVPIEEDQIKENPDKYLTFTDSDDEKMFAQAVETDPQYRGEEEKEGVTMEEANILLPQSAFSATKRIHYTGDDLEGYMKELRTNYPQFLFTSEKTEQGEQYVIATLVKERLFDAKEVMYLSEKYEAQMLAGGKDLDIDPKDQPLFEKLAKLKNIDPQKAAIDLVEQLADMQIKQHMDEIMPTVEEMKNLKELTLDEYVKEFRRRRDEALR